MLNFSLISLCFLDHVPSMTKTSSFKLLHHDWFWRKSILTNCPKLESFANEMSYESYSDFLRHCRKFNPTLSVFISLPFGGISPLPGLCLHVICRIAGEAFRYRACINIWTDSFQFWLRNCQCGPLCIFGNLAHAAKTEWAGGVCFPILVGARMSTRCFLISLSDEWVHLKASGESMINMQNVYIILKKKQFTLFWEYQLIISKLSKNIKLY